MDSSLSSSSSNNSTLNFLQSFLSQTNSNLNQSNSSPPISHHTVSSPSYSSSPNKESFWSPSTSPNTVKNSNPLFTPIEYSQLDVQQSRQSLFAIRVKKYREEIEKPVIDLKKIQAYGFEGIPEDKGLRQLYWKILLNYLPLQKSLWQSSIQRCEENYRGWVNEFFVNPRALSLADTETSNHRSCDHPLSIDPKSSWNAYFKCRDMLHEIDKDVKRTLPHLHFFQEGNEDSTEKPQPQQAHIATNNSDAIRRILYVYAKLNPGINYVQGMNEIVGPLYYVFATDPDIEAKQYAESATFYCFTNLMSEIMNNFIKTLDRAEGGIVAAIGRLNQLLHKKDPELWLDLETKKMNPQFYSFRWITLLLSQEFDLPDVLRLWDSLFSDSKRFDFLYHFCCAMLVNVREELLENSFAENLKLLQNYPPSNLNELLNLARKLKDPNCKISEDPRSRTDEVDFVSSIVQSFSKWSVKENSPHEYPFGLINPERLFNCQEEEEECIDESLYLQNPRYDFTNDREEQDEEEEKRNKEGNNNNHMFDDQMGVELDSPIPVRSRS